MPSAAAKKGSRPFRFFLGVLVLAFSVAAAIVTSALKNKKGQFSFSPKTAVVMSELIKFAMSAAVFYRNRLVHPKTTRWTVSAVGIAKYAIPAALYGVVNVTGYLVFKYLSPAEFQVFNNSKIVVTALVFRGFLGRRLKVMQWVCVLLMTVGMCVVAIPSPDATTTTATTVHHDTHAAHGPSRTQSRGLHALLAGLAILSFNVFSSAFAGVYSEFLLKKGNDDNNWKNMQLYAWGIVFVGGNFLLEGHALTPHAFFRGWTPLTWVAVLIYALYGQVIALTFRYGDNMLKVNANSIASLVTAAADWVLFREPVTVAFLFGSVIVCTTVRVYYCVPDQLVMDDVEYLFLRHNEEEGGNNRRTREKMTEASRRRRLANRRLAGAESDDEEDVGLLAAEGTEKVDEAQEEEGEGTRRRNRAAAAERVV